MLKYITNNSSISNNFSNQPFASKSFISASISSVVFSTLLDVETLKPSEETSPLGGAFELGFLFTVPVRSSSSKQVDFASTSSFALNTSSSPAAGGGGERSACGGGGSLNTSAGCDGGNGRFSSSFETRSSISSSQGGSVVGGGGGTPSRKHEGGGGRSIALRSKCGLLLAVSGFLMFFGFGGSLGGGTGLSDLCGTGGFFLS